MTILPPPEKIRAAYQKVAPLANKRAFLTLRIISLEPGLSVSEIYEHPEIRHLFSDYSQTCQTLKTLIDRGLVKKERDEKCVHYYPHREYLRRLKKILHEASLPLTTTVVL